MSAGARLSFASVVHNPGAAEQALLPSIRALDEAVQTLTLSNVDNVLTTNIASLYNVLLRLDGPVLRAFVHPDVSFERDIVERLLRAIETLDRAGETWGALGIVGRAWDGAYAWCNEIDEPVRVCTLDSCFVLTRTDLPLAFDARRFDEFHCFVEDYCLQCHAAGYGVWVVPAAARHEGTAFREQGSRWGRYDRYRKRLDRKWRGRYPDLTTT